MRYRVGFRRHIAPRKYSWNSSSSPFIHGHPRLGPFQELGEIILVTGLPNGNHDGI